MRSYVRREGRMTVAQRQALATLWPRYGIDAGREILVPRKVFGREAPLHLEIGFGMGDTLLALAKGNPQCDYLGVEVHRPGVGRLLLGLAERELQNVRVLCADAGDVLEHNLAPHSLAAIYLLFPDPWPKKRHHKRRLVQPAWAALACSRLRLGGELLIATDWQDYAEHMLDVLDGTQELTNCAGAGHFAPPGEGRPETKFERRGRRLGHAVWELRYRRGR